MYDCVPPFLIAIAPWDIATPFVEPPATPNVPAIVALVSAVKTPVTSNVPAISMLVSSIELTIESAPITKSNVLSESS